jgi:DNA polymerase III subunit epsilon
MLINKRNKFLWFAVISILLTFVFFVSMMVLFWTELSPIKQDFLFEIIKENGIYFFISFLLFFAAFGFAIDAILNNFFIPMMKLTDEITVISTVNASHRIKIEGGNEILNLANSINEFADTHENLKKIITDEINKKRAELYTEKNMLAALLDELPQGVIACNAEGVITLFNKKAKLIEGEDCFIGIGRSVFEIIDKDIITNALYEINIKKIIKDAAAFSSFITLSANNVLIKADISPITDNHDNFAGFIIVFYNIAKDFKFYAQTDSLFKFIANKISSVLEKIKLMADESLKSEINLLENTLKESESNYLDRIKERLPFLIVSDRDIITSVQKRAQDKLGISLKPEFSENINWIKIETYSFIYAFMAILIILKKTTKSDSFECNVLKEDNFLTVSFHIPDPEKGKDILKKWNDSIALAINDDIPLTLKDFLNYHEASLNLETSKGGKIELKLSMPLAEMKEPENIRNITILSEDESADDRPEFYDFELFSKQLVNPNLTDSRLRDISYTVFDTETTGLDTKNDEIISIGALRIVNNKILYNEKFEQLINPYIPIPYESEKIHGITDETLKDKPNIKEVLPLFYQFAHDTVLVAHNGAFDMKMFDMKQKYTGINFNNLLLDTMILASIVYPVHEKHNMKILADIAGVNIIGRHTAMGDAIATAQIFLKLIPLLEKKKIFTLQDAVEASKKTLYAKLKY